MKTTMTMAALSLALLAAASSSAQAAAGTTASVVTQENLSTMAALQLAGRATEIANSRDMKICIAVTDANGYLLAFKRMDGAAPGCIEAAMKKANSAAINDVDTVVFYDPARKENLQLGSIPGILPAVAGGVIRQKEQAVGAIGVAVGADDAQEQRFATELVRAFERTLPALNP